MQFLRMRSMRFYVGFLVVLALTIGGSAIAAFADSGTATVAVGAGNLTEAGVTNVSATPVTLTGDDQTTQYSLGFTVTDARGNGAGWHLTITSTLFDNGAQQLSSSASNITGVGVSCSGVGGHCTSPTNSYNYPLAVPAASTAPTAVPFFNAAANTGLGKFTITPTITVSIPGNTYAGTYTSTDTIAVVAGP